MTDPQQNTPTANDSSQASEADALSMLPSQETLLASQSKENPSSSKADEQLNANKAMDKLEDDTRSPRRTSVSSELEDQAVERGWVPRDDFKGNKDNWVSAREFVDRSNMLDKISRQNKEIKQMKSTTQQLVDMLKGQAKKSSESEASKILEQKREAIVQGDVEAAETYENKYNELKQEIQGFKDLEYKQQANSEVPLEVVEFANRNKTWFNDDSPENIAMKQYALQIEDNLMKQYPSWDTVLRLEEVERRVKTFFHDKFENPNRNRAPSVERKTYNTKKGQSDLGYADLPKEARAIVDQFVRTEGKSASKNKLSADEYAKKLFETGAIKNE